MLRPNPSINSTVENSAHFKRRREGPTRLLPKCVYLLQE
jgi:hypothetical protein